MKSMSFSYTKPNGDVSSRVFIPLVTPNANYFGVDISELSLEDQVAIELDFKDLEDERTKKVAELMSKYDIRHSFRTFSPERMNNVEFHEVE